MITLGIINFNLPHHVYYLIESIKKQCKFDYEIVVFEAGQDRPIINHVDNVTILRNRGFKYFDSTDMTGLQVYNHALKELMAYCKTDDMIILDNKSLVKGNLLAFVDQSYRTVKDKNASIVYLNMKRIRKERLEAFEKDTDEMYKNFFTDSCMEKTSVNQLVTVDHIMSDAKFIEWIMHNKHLSPSAKRIPSSSARRRAAPYAPPSRLSNTG